MEKRASNTFVGGLVTDRHPLSAQNTELIDARNIDLIQVGEGYQLILQKREGNTEVLITPVGWNEVMPYRPGEYVTHLDVIYIAIASNTNVNPADDVTFTFWEIVAGPVVPAGLPIGFIPLAVKEFNNIAYIISVNPITEEGEIGTFPSPDYSEYIYVTGINPITPAPIIWPGIPDLRVRNNYEFTITPISNSGDDEIIDTDTLNYQLLYAGFTIKNEGLLEDTYTFNTTETGGVLMYHDGVLLINNATITLFPGISSVITFKHQDPFTEPMDAPYYEPNVLNDVIVTVTSNNGIIVAQTYEYKYHIAPMLAVRYTDTGYTVVPSYPPQLPIGTYYPTKVIDINGGYTQFQWITNDTSLVQVDTMDFSTFPSWPGDLEDHGIDYVDLNMGENIIPMQPTRVGTYTLAGDYAAKDIYPSGTITCILHCEQTHG